MPSSNYFYSCLRLCFQLPNWVKWGIVLFICSIYSILFYNLFVSPTGFRWRAIYGDPDYPAGYTIHGIDVSRYQGSINWNRLRNAMIERSPIRFIIIKSTGGDLLILSEPWPRNNKLVYVRSSYCSKSDMHHV